MENVIPIFMEANKLKIVGAFSRIGYEPINLNSPDQIKKYLLSIGWKPKTWNYQKDGKRIVKGQDGKPIKTSPKLPKGEELEDLERELDSPIGKLIARRYILKHRKSILTNDDSDDKGWLNLVRDDGRLGAVCVPQATNTGRGRHKVVVNVPKAKKKIPFGIELRSCLTAHEGEDLCGTDASALEARIMAHYVYPYDGGPEMAEMILHGDIHSHNAKIFGVDRDTAKSGLYCLNQLGN